MDFINRDFFLGKLLALKGAKVILLLDDGMLKHWESGLNINYSYHFRKRTNGFRNNHIA